MSGYVLKFKGREVARGDFLTVLIEANARGGIVTVTPSQRGWKWNRLLLDLPEQFEILESSAHD